MPSCPIAPLAESLTCEAATPVELTDRDRHGLLEALQDVPDPRDPRGIRYRLASLLAVAVCAVLAGAVTYAGIADWLEDLPEADLPALGLSRRPVATTAWRLLIRVDSIALSRLLARWLLSRLPPTSTPTDQAWASVPGQRVVGIDGKTVCGTVQPDGTCTHLLSAYDVITGITLAQIPLAAKGGQIAQVKPLVDQVEAVIGSVARRGLRRRRPTRTNHSRHGPDRPQGSPVRTGQGQPAHAVAASAVPALAPGPGRRPHREAGHGRRETRTCKTVTVTVPGGLGFPHAAQAVRITRTRRLPNATTTTLDAPQPKAFKTTRETAYLIVTLPHEQASPVDLNLWARLEWFIENKSHWVGI